MTPSESAAPAKSPLKLASVGGGRTCQFFLDIIKNNAFPFQDIKRVGVCDIDPEAEGLVTARQMSIPTTSDFHEFFTIPDLDGIIELTNSETVFLELIKQRPKELGILEHKIGKLLRNMFLMHQRLKTVEQQVLLGKMSSDFLIRQSNAAIVMLNTLRIQVNDFRILRACWLTARTVPPAGDKAAAR